MVIWASWVALIAVYVRVFYFIVFGTLFTSMANDAVEIASTVVVSVVLLLFIQFGALEYDRMVRYLREDKKEKHPESMAFSEQAELRKHWLLIVVGSSVGLLAIIARTLYHFFTGDLPVILGNEIVEGTTTGIVLLVFVWFVYMGAVEFKQTRHLMEQNNRPQTV